MDRECNQRLWIIQGILLCEAWARGFVTVKRTVIVCISFHTIMQALRSVHLHICSRERSPSGLTTIHLQSAMRQSCGNQTSILAHYFVPVCALCYRLDVRPGSTYCCCTREHMRRGNAWRWSCQKYVVHVWHFVRLSVCEFCLLYCDSAYLE